MALMKSAAKNRGKQTPELKVERLNQPRMKPNELKIRKKQLIKDQTI